MEEILENRYNTSKWFFFTLLYIIIDYGRPQDILHIAFLKPAFILIIILSGYLLTSGKIFAASIKQIKMIWLFIILLAIFIPFATNNYFAYLATKDMLLYMPFIISTIICVNSLQRLKKTIFIFVCLMIYIALFSFIHKGVGSGNYFQDENDVSLYINMWIPFCFFLFFVTKEWTMKIIYFMGLILGVLTVIISSSRGGFIGLVTISFVCWLSSSKKVLSLIILGLLVIMVVTLASDAYWHRMNTIKDTDTGTAAERIESWKAGWRMFLDNPWGVGGNNFQARFHEYQSGWFGSKGMWGRVAHSLWFTLMPELGIAGIFIYFILLKYNIKDILYLKKIKQNDQRKNPDLEYLHALSGAFIASLAGYFSSGSFVSVLYYPHYWYLTGIIVAATNVAKGILTRNELRADLEKLDKDISDNAALN
jgi:probable O-glycosylation ligase (exosortase A-associated)